MPLLVGHPPSGKTEAISAALAKYWVDPETFFIISSDFCHWYASCDACFQLTVGELASRALPTTPLHLIRPTLSRLSKAAPLQLPSRPSW